MKTFKIANSNYSYDVSKIIFGTTYLGNMDDREEAYSHLDFYYNHGGRCIDTARVYSNIAPEDKFPSEAVVGEWLTKRNLRNEIIISTKGGHPPYGDMHTSRLSYDDISYDVDESLKALQTDYIDIYWLHRDDESIPASEIIISLNKIISDGRIRIIGASNWTSKRIKEANDFAQENNLIGFSSSQIQWALAKTSPIDFDDDTLVCMNDEEYNAYKLNGIPVMAYNSQAKGLFSKMLNTPIEDLTEKIINRFLNDSYREDNIKRFERIKTLSEKYQVSPAVITLGYLTNNQVSCGAIIGCSNIPQLSDSLSAGDFTLTPDDVDFLIK